MLSALRTLITQLIEAGGLVASLCTLIMAFSITADVSMRGFTGSNVPGLLELNETLLVVIVFFGVGYAALRGEHIRMTLVTDKLPNKVSRIMRIIGDSVVLVLLAWMFYATLEAAMRSWDINEVRLGIMNWPLWPARFAISVGTAMWVMAVVKTFGRRPEHVDAETPVI